MVHSRGEEKKKWPNHLIPIFEEDYFGWNVIDFTNLVEGHVYTIGIIRKSWLLNDRGILLFSDETIEKESITPIDGI